MKKLYESVFPEDEMTAYGFISHMEAYIKDLLDDPVHAQPDEYLKKHEIDGPKALGMLLKRVDPNNPDSAVLKRKVRIAPDKEEEGQITEDENAPKPKDKYHIKYSLPRQNYHKKMRKLYDSLQESYIVNEDGEGGTMADMGGATTCGASSGAFIQPLTKKPLRRQLHITQEQADYIKNSLLESSPAVMNTQAGDFGYDAPASICSDDDPTLDHKDMMKKSWAGK